MKYKIILIYIVVSINFAYSSTNDRNKLSVVDSLELNTAYKNALNWYKQDKDSALFYAKKVITIKKNSIDTIMGNTLKLIGSTYLISHQYDSAKHYYNKALIIYKTLKFYKGIDATYNNLGIIYMRQNNLNMAISSMKQSLKYAIESKNLLSKAKTLHNLGWIYEEKEAYDTALIMYLKALKEKRKFNDTLSISYTLNNIGNIYNAYYDYDKALKYYNKALEYSLKLNNKKVSAIRYYNIASIYEKTNKYKLSVTNYLKALSIYKSNNNNRGIARINNSLGGLYSDWRNYKTAIKHYRNAIRFALRDNDTTTVGDYYNNIGICYESLGYFSAAKKYYKKALKSYNSTIKTKKILVIYENLAGLYEKQKKYKTSKKYYLKALKIAIKINSKYQIANIKQLYSSLLIKTRRYKLAKKTLTEARLIAKSIESNVLQLSIYKNLINLSVAQRKYKKAYYYQKYFLKIHDSIFNQKSVQQSIILEKRYQLESKEKEIELLNSKAIISELKQKTRKIELDKTKIVKNYAIFFNALLFIIALIILYVLRLRQKSNKELKLINSEILQQQEEITAQRDEIEVQYIEISKQKSLLETQNNDITQSIKYASYIQSGLLPEKQIFSSNFTQHFIINKPKDIVSGDLYFAKETASDIFVSVVDCTGHGVPGALMSLLGYNALQLAIEEHSISNTSEILTFINNYVKGIIKHDSKSIDIGMDMSLIKINKTSKQLSFSGARQPLILVHKGELQEIKGTKRTIGQQLHKSLPNFKSENIQLYSNDIIYMFSDGYSDQFGGIHEQKYKKQNLKNKIIEIQNSNLDAQKNILIRTFEQWKGNLDQIDDVLIIGLKI